VEGGRGEEKVEGGREISNTFVFPVFLAFFNERSENTNLQNDFLPMNVIFGGFISISRMFAISNTKNAISCSFQSKERWVMW
jgi:hypothetical protein